MKLTKEDREEMKAHAMLSRLAGFKRVQILIEHAIELLDTIDVLEKERDHYLEALETIASDALPGCLDRLQCARDYLDGEEEEDE